MKFKKPNLIWMIIAVALTCVTLFAYVNLASGQEKLEHKIEAEDSVEHPHFEKILGDLMGPAFRSGNEIVTLKNGEEIFPAMLRAISQAKKTITFESYIYWSGSIGSRFVEALAARAREGVKVHVLLDWVGSDRIEDEYIRRMTEAGVEVERYHQPAWYNLSRLNNRTHRKILVVDGKVGFTGGVGIADEWDGNGLDPKRWRDTHYRVRGPVVAQMQAAFLDNWMKVRPEVHQSRAYFPDLESPDQKVTASVLSRAQMFKSSSRDGTSSVHIMYLLAIAAAKKTIFLESAYFVPDDLTIKELVKARSRGVDIQIIVPGELTDAKIVHHASRESWEDLLKAGIQIFEYQPALFHCKVMIVDDYFVSVGSTNFDERSFNLNDEANLNVLSHEFAAEQIRVFELDKRRSREVTLATWNARPLLDRAAEKIATLFRSQL